MNYFHKAGGTRLIGALALGVAMGTSGSSGAIAATVTPDNVNPWGHIVDCFGAMLHDPATHHDNCAPNPYVPAQQLAPTSGGGTYCAPQQKELLRGPEPFDVNVASLGNGAEYVPITKAINVAYQDPCGGNPCPVDWLGPDFGRFHIASLNDAIDVRREIDLFKANQVIVAGQCCQPCEP